MTKRLNRPRTGTIVALDIGTSKVCCLIARVDRPAIENGSNVVAQPRIVGSGLQVSAGLKNGVIVDVDVAETAIRKAVFAAEQMAGDNIRSVTVNLSGGKPTSRTIGIDVDIGNRNFRAEFCQLTRDSKSNPTGTTGDEGRSTGEIHMRAEWLIHCL